MNTQFYLNNLWRWKCGLPENEPETVTSYDELKHSEWSDEFEQLMRNRLIIGAFRYGKIGAIGKPKYDRINSIINRLGKYRKRGNKEYLVDCANLCLLEFAECQHRNQNFNSIDDGEHVSKIE